MNFPCPHCENPTTHGHGDRRRKCPVCGKTFRVDKITDIGRPALGWKALTNAEKQRRWRERHKTTKNNHE